MDKKEAAKILNVGPEATVDEINRAFRHRSKKHHPDKPSGSQEAFVRLQIAHDVLLGKEEPKSDASQAIGEFISAFQTVVGRCKNPLKVDLIKNTKERLEQLKTETNSQVKSVSEDIDMTKGIIERLTCSGEDNFLLGMLNQHLTAAEQALTSIKLRIENLDNAIIISNNYKYNPDPTENNFSGGMWGNLTNITFTTGG